jgi:hypothetical protein
MHLELHGAARTVTGSMHILRTALAGLLEGRGLGRPSIPGPGDRIEL